MERTIHPASVLAYAYQLVREYDEHQLTVAQDYEMSYREKGTYEGTRDGTE